ncbi:MAG: hypothetical protein M3Z33_09465 [Actinomycetota bacterium]|nr:hypothetical protein [Actinomycetota bacterium]
MRASRAPTSRALRCLAAAVVAAALPASASAADVGPGYSFLRSYTDQLGVAGNPAGTSVTAQSDLYTGWAELSLRAGPGLASFPSEGRTLDGGRYPILTTSRRIGRVLYTFTTFAASVGSQEVNFARVRAVNTGKKAARAQITAFVRDAGAPLVTHPGPRTYRSDRFGRPAAPARTGLYFQPGAEFNPLAAYSFAGRTLLRDGGVIYDFPPAPAGAKVYPSLRIDAAPVDRQTSFGQTAYLTKLKAGQGVVLDFHMPVAPIAAGPQYARIQGSSFNVYRRKTTAEWARFMRAATRIDLPERKAVDTYYASLMDIALPRYRAPNGAWVQAVNNLRYHAFWLRDGAVMANALDLVGLHGQAGEDLGFFLDWQNPDGLFISRPGQLDGFGQTLWAFGEHLRRTGNGAFAGQVYPAVRRAMAWFIANRAADPLRLLPPGNPGDNEYVAGHLAGDNFWAIAGIEQAVEMARRLHQSADLARWSAELADYRGTVQAQARAAAARSGGYIPPAFDVPGGQDWGNYWAAYPGSPFAATDPLVTATLNHARSEFGEGIGTYGDPHMLHGVIGYRAFETMLRRGEQANVVRGFYDSLAHTTSTNASFETGVLPLGNRTVDLATVPHGWGAAEYVSLLRNMLIREEGTGLVLMSALSPSWLKPGQTVSVRGGATAYGPLDFALRTSSGGATLTWTSRLRRGAGLTVPVPVGARNVHAPGLKAGVIHLRGRKGRINITWRLSGPAPSYSGTVRALLARYRRGGRGARSAAHNAAPAYSQE